MICGAGNAKIVTTETKLRPGDLQDLESESLKSGLEPGSGSAAAGVANKLILTVLRCRQSYAIRLCLFLSMVLMTGVVEVPLKELTYLFSGIPYVLRFSLNFKLSTKTVIELLNKHE